jgi:hypothetical protein
MTGRDQDEMEPKEVAMFATTLDGEWHVVMGPFANEQEAETYKAALLIVIQDSKAKDGDA